MFKTLSRARLPRVLFASTVVVAALAAVPTTAVADTQGTAITMFSQQGDYIGGGASREFDRTNATFSGTPAASGLSMSASGGTSGTQFSFNIAPPAGASFGVGYYTGAQRTPFRSAGRPGIDIYGDGRGCNEVAGAFEVRDLAYSGTTIVRLDLLYEQHCEGGTPALFGELQVSEPQPAGLVVSSSSITWPAVGLGGAGSTIPVYIRNPGSNPVSIGPASIDGYSAGEFGLHLDSCSGQTLPPTAACSVYVSFLPSARGPRTARLHLPLGASSYNIQLDGQLPEGETSLAMQSDSGDYVGAGASYNFTSANATFGFNGTPNGLAVNLSANDGEWWTLDMYAAQGQVLDVGLHDNASRYPFNGSGNGLSVYGDGRGCNNLTGSFTVIQASFSPVDNSMQHFDATFVQHCEGQAPALRGEIKYKSAPVITQPPPVTDLAASRSGGGLALTWTNPSASPYSYTVVRAEQGGPVGVAPTAGTAIYSGSDAHVLARSLRPDAPYTITVFTVDTYGNVSYPTQLSVVGPPRLAAGVDFNGDQTTDVSVFRPSAGAWYGAGATSPIYFGLPGDIAVPGDYNGDGITEIAVFRPSSGAWFIDGNQAPAAFFGLAGDVPVPADYNGDGTADIAVFRPSTGAWYISGAAQPVSFGLPGDVPVPGDYNGDGKADMGVFRPSTGAWFVDVNPVGTPFGRSGDIPVPGDYNGDGTTDIAVFRPSTGAWYINGAPSPVIFGSSGDIPVAGDYNGDGTTDLAVFRPSVGAWYINGPPWVTYLGLSGDAALPLSAAGRQAFFP